MKYDFDQLISREDTASLKFDARLATFGRTDVQPLWVADMDFAAPPAVQRALAERAAHPIYGYTVYPDVLYDTLIAWLAERHGWQVQREWLMFCPGVVPSLHAAIMALSHAGEGVIVQPPVYAPFLSVAEITGRKSLLNPLKEVNGQYHFDLADFERCAAGGARILLLCSPHNPVGRVWREDELLALLDICHRYAITVISDEIHADLVFAGHRHVPLAKLAGDRVKVITALAPSKTFNIPGLGLSMLIVPDKVDRVAIAQVFGMLHVSASNPFSIAASVAAYREGAPWLDALLVYLKGTHDAVHDYAAQHLPGIKVGEAQGTYLLWLDCRALGMDDAALKRFFVQQAGLGLSPGSVFGAQGCGYMRLNIGAPRALVLQALDKLAAALRAR
ncbi:MAG: PatB family C-S lyase [Gallionella sp.]|nr:PatB family C-S lyase [Gallionella sp.]